MRRAVRAPPLRKRSGGSVLASLGGKVRRFMDAPVPGTLVGKSKALSNALSLAAEMEALSVAE